MKFVFEYDSITKEGKLTAGEEVMENLSSFTAYDIYNQPGKFYIEARQTFKDEDNKMWKSHVVCAEDGEVVIKNTSADVLKEQAEKLLKGK